MLFFHYGVLNRSQSISILAQTQNLTVVRHAPEARAVTGQETKKDSRDETC